MQNSLLPLHRHSPEAASKLSNTMTRVSNAAAITLQAWSRTVLAKKEASDRLHEKQMRQSEAKASFFEDRGLNAGLVLRRILVVATCVALVGVTTQAVGAPQMLASSPALTTSGTSSSSPAGIVQVAARSIQSLLFSNTK